MIPFTITWNPYYWIYNRPNGEDDNIDTTKDTIPGDANVSEVGTKIDLCLHEEDDGEQNDVGNVPSDTSDVDSLRDMAHSSQLTTSNNSDMSYDSTSSIRDNERDTKDHPSGSDKIPSMSMDPLIRRKTVLFETKNRGISKKVIPRTSGNHHIQYKSMSHFQRSG